MGTKLRQGPGIPPVTTTAGTPGTSDRFYTFSTPARPCILYNDTGVTVYVKMNVTESSPASTSDFDLKITAGGFIDLSLGGQVAVYTVSVYAASGSYDSVIVKGWYP